MDYIWFLQRKNGKCARFWKGCSSRIFYCLVFHLSNLLSCLGLEMHFSKFDRGKINLKIFKKTYTQSCCDLATCTCTCAFGIQGCKLELQYESCILQIVDDYFWMSDCACSFMLAASCLQLLAFSHPHGMVKPCQRVYCNLQYTICNFAHKIAYEILQAWIKTRAARRGLNEVLPCIYENVLNFFCFFLIIFY